MKRFYKNEDEKIYCINFNKYRNFLNAKIWYIFEKALFLSIVGGKCGSNDKKEESKKEDSIDILKTLAFIKNMKEYQRNTKLFSRQIWLKKRKVNNFDSKI